MSDVEWTRYFIIFVLQSVVIIFFLIITFRILKRNRNRLTSILSTFYLLVTSGLFFNLVLLPINNNPTSKILYFITYLLITFGQIFLVVFLRNLLNLDVDTNSKLDFFIIFLYASLISIPFFIPEGFSFNESTNWIPIYSWNFLKILYSILTVMIIIPSTIIFKKLYDKFEKNDLKKKLRYFTAGSYGMFFTSYGAILYNTWQNPIFKLVWTFLSLIIIPSAFLIYYGIARNL
ncbi:MAG: hypothetical protein HWN81_14170 [Candidatus Lokiarchaeota archaeon]|nr:hypothetical protein [Candidatus Lokiarchaeota archaeon]